MSKINIDSLVAALTNDKVAEALSTVLKPLIQLSIDELVSKRLTEVSEGLASLKAELRSKNEQVTQLSKQNAELKQTITNQAHVIEQLEAYNRQDNLIIQGIPSSYAQVATGASNSNSEHSSETEELVLNLCHSTLDVDIQPGDISICHRLPKGDRQDHAPIIVRFTSRKARNAVLAARRKLRNESSRKVYINEHLTRHASKLFAAGRRLLKDKKIAQVWTKNGLVVVKMLNGTVKPITCETDLQF